MEPGPPQLSAAAADAARYLGHWLELHHQIDRVPGVQAAVRHGDDLLLSRALGVADVSTGEALTTEHRFRIASHSKTFTATAIVRLVQEGRLRLDDRLGDHVADVADPAVRARTLRELLGHGSGLVRDGWDGDHWQLVGEFPDRSRLLAMAGDDAAVLAANERFKYSNVAYSLLGLVVEAVTGLPYADHVAAQLLAPLGLAATSPDLSAVPAGVPLATGHTGAAFDGRRIPIDHVDTAAMAAATGFVSTAVDVTAWAAAHFAGDERILDDASKRLMQRTEWKVVGSANGEYALGLAVTTINDRRLLGHGGGFPGHITHTLFDPTERLAVSVLTNAIDGPAQMYAATFYRLLDLALQTDPDPTELDLSTFTGRFANLWGVYDIVELGGGLWYLDATVGDPTADPIRLEVADADTLRIAEAPGYGSPGERFTYERAADGAVLTVRGGSATTARPYETMREAMAASDRIQLGHSPVRP